MLLVQFSLFLHKVIGRMKEAQPYMLCSLFINDYTSAMCPHDASENVTYVHNIFDATYLTPGITHSFFVRQHWYV